MDKTLRNIISTIFNTLFFLTPLIVIPITSELFEFNKIVVVYLSTIILTALWISRMIIEKKVIFRRTILDIPLLLFLIVNVVSVYFSIDRYTSLLGYYSRFNGGLFSTLSYSLLYWIFVSNVTKSGVTSSIKSVLFSSFFVSTYAILQHFGIDKDIWEQDVQNRVFATLGQPNWLAAWIVSIIPITWGLMFAKKKSEKANFSYYGACLLSITLFLTLLYTKSRSGLLGFGLSLVIFLGTTLFITLKNNSPLTKSGFLKSFLILLGIYLLIAFVIGTPWTPRLSSYITNPEISDVSIQETAIGPALETGGTDSGEIRKIVWKGAYDVWKNNPLFGTGVETFAYSYYKYRPVEHNLVSEWDFLYNKAHNEYLNHLATIGLTGLIANFLFIIVVLILFIKSIKYSLSTESAVQLFLPIAFMSGFSGVLVTNIFGFSVVLTSLNMFLLPALAVSLRNKNSRNNESKSFNMYQKASLFIVIFVFVFLFTKVFFYWYSDVLYTKAKTKNKINDYASSLLYITEALDYQPYQAIYYDELAETNLSIALLMYTNDEIDSYEKYKKSAISSSEMATELSPFNMNIRRNNASMYLKLSTIDEDYLPIAAETINNAIILAPTDAKLYYNLGVVIAKMGKVKEAIDIFNKTIDLKANYRDARYALGVLYVQEGESELAKEQFLYILGNIAPNDKKAQEELNKI